MKLPIFASVALLAFTIPAMADDFGARFGGTGTTALQDTPGEAMPGDDILNISPAAGDETGAAAPVIQKTPMAATPTTKDMHPAPQNENAATEATLDGPAEPEPTAQERTESNVINYDRGMSPDETRDASYRLQDTAD